LLGASFAKNLDGHQNHFHLEFRTPTKVDIDTSQNLLADEAPQFATNDAVAATRDLDDAVALACADLNLDSGDATMMTIDLPSTPPAAQVVLIAQAPQAAVPVTGRVAGVCQAVDYRTPDGEDGSYWPEFNGGLDPQTIAELCFSRYESRPDVQRPPFNAVEVLTQPRHGIVKLGTGEGGGAPPQYNYIPDLNYVGTDKITFRVTTSAGPVVVQYYLVVTNKGSESSTSERLCDKASNHLRSKAGWKISSSFTTPSLDNAALQALLDATGKGVVQSGVEDEPGITHLG
jgi:hypothetical protein